MLYGKKVVVIGERDGVAAPAIKACIESVPSEVIYAYTACFV